MSAEMVQEAEAPPGPSGLDASSVSSQLNELSLSTPLPPVSASRTTGPGIVATDITDRFVAAASTLQPGELVKDKYFTLFESVAALEIMDPKMDPGCDPSAQHSEEAYDLERPLAPEEVLGIIDQLLCLEMAWHLGYPLPQTILTNRYIFAMLSTPPASLAEADFVRGREAASRPLTHSVLRAYCLALVKTCWDVLERIKREVYYEEEDFSTNTYHVALLGGFSSEEIRHLVQSVRQDVADDGGGASGWSRELVLALDARLDFRHAFSVALELAELQAPPDALRQPWQHMRAAMERVVQTHGLGTAVPASFSIALQQQLASTMPPRPMVQPGFADEAAPRWLGLCDDAAEATGVLAYAHDPQSVLSFVQTFQARRPAQQPLVLVRCLLQSFLFSDNNVVLGAYSVRQLLDDDFALVVLPGSVLLDPANDDVEAVHDARFTMARYMEEFRQRAFPAYLDLLRALCQNRSRARRMLCHVVKAWEQVQMDAEDLDQLLQPLTGETPLRGPGGGGGEADKIYALPLSSWALHYKQRAMEWIVQLGFELEVYQPDELAGMYWYLSYLARNRRHHTDRIRVFVERGAGMAAAAGEAERSPARTLAFARLTLQDAAATEDLAAGLAGLYLALARLGLLRAPPRPYGSDERRYELRMRPFAGIGLPELPAFADFAAATQQPGRSTHQVLAQAEAALARAKRGAETLAKSRPGESFAQLGHERWAARTKNMLKAAILAGLAVAAVRKGMDKAAAVRGASRDDKSIGAALPLAVEIPTPDKSYHEWWIVPKITAAPS